MGCSGSIMLSENLKNEIIKSKKMHNNNNESNKSNKSNESNESNESSHQTNS